MYVGREDTLKFLAKSLLPPYDGSGQRIIVLSGLGGIGKTQLAIRFAKNNERKFTAIFWINAQSESTLRKHMVMLANRIASPASSNPRPEEVNGGQDEENHKIEVFKAWLSKSDNRKWLLIFDNHDDPKTGVQEDTEQISTAYDLKQYFPHRSQGSILVTTRRARLSFGKVLPLRKFDSVQNGLDMLARRSLRPDIKEGVLFS